MESAKLIFILGIVLGFGVAPLLVKDVRRYFLCLASFLNIFSTGWIFYFYTGIMLADIPIFCLLAIGIVKGVKFNWRLSPIGGPVLSLIGIAIVTSFWAVQPGWDLAETSKYIRMYLVMVVITQNIKGIRDLRLVVFSMLSGLVFEAALGFYQNYFGALGIWFLGERLGNRVDWRAMGTFYVAAFYANYVVTLIFVAYRMFVYYRSQKVTQSIFFGAAFCLGMVALVKSYARGPWLGFLIAFAVISLITLFRSRFKSYSKWAIPVFLFFSLFVAIRYNQKILDQFGASRRTAYEVRFTQFAVAQRMIAASPFMGVGLSNYDQNSWKYLTQEEKDHFLVMVYAMMVHNSYLLYAVELGIPGAIILILWFLMMIITCARILRAKISHPLITNTTMGILGGVIAFMILMISSPDIHEYSILYQLGLFSGILLAEIKLIKRAEWQKICNYRNGLVRSQNGESEVKTGINMHHHLGGV